MNRRVFATFLAGVPSMIAGCKLKPVEPTGPVAFGYKMQWITVRCEVVQEVVDSFRLVHPRPATW